MIQIKEYPDYVSITLPTEVITFTRRHFDWYKDNIYFIRSIPSNPTNVIREKGNIEDMNFGHWNCLKYKYQARFNDFNIKSLDVDFMVKELNKVFSKGL